MKKHIGILLLSMTAMLAGCDAQTTVGARPEARRSVVVAKPGATHTLTIIGYNYTNRYINQFDVDGAGGSNLDVSTPDAGGGKGTCCIVWRDGTALPVTIHVKWDAGGCMRTATNSLGERSERVHHFFKEKDIVFGGPVPADPGYLEVHFYPDDHIEVAITTLFSDPRLKLDPARAVDPYPYKCETGK